jgi:DNA-damage-inducible protein J
MANLNIRVDDTLKEQAETVLDYIGLSLSAATTIFLKQVVHSKGIPFELRADPFYSPEHPAKLPADTEKELDKRQAAYERLKKYKGTLHRHVDYKTELDP